VGGRDEPVAVAAHLRAAARAAGDCAGTPLRMACATAMPMGCHAADVVVRAARGAEPRPFRFGFLIRCVSLGRSRGLIQGVDALDGPTWALGGRTAAAVKEAICQVAARSADWEAGSGVPLYGWSKAELTFGPGEAVA
jgi:NADH:ubiquinone reductase (H+-translocating)